MAPVCGSSACHNACKLAGAPPAEPPAGRRHPFAFQLRLHDLLYAGCLPGGTLQHQRAPDTLQPWASLHPAATCSSIGQLVCSLMPRQPRQSLHAARCRHPATCLPRCPALHQPAQRLNPNPARNDRCAGSRQQASVRHLLPVSQSVTYSPFRQASPRPHPAGLTRQPIIIPSV